MFPEFRNLQHLKCTCWSDTACAIFLWKGELLADISKDNKIEAAVIVDCCNENMSAFANYLDDKSENIKIREIAFISRCPESLLRLKTFPMNFA